MRASFFLLATTGSAYRVAVQSDIGVKEASASETEVCCLCFDEDGEKTTWDIKTFDDDSSSELQGAGFMDCRQDQGDGTSKCSEHCASQGFQMKGCMKSAGMLEWRDSAHWSALTTSGENSWSCRTDAEGSSCGCAGEATPAAPQEEEEEEEEEETPALIQQAAAPDGEVCCLCFEEDGEKTTWDVKTFDDDDSATLQGAGFMDCRHAQDDGTSKCEAHCESLGFQMKGCEKSHGMFMWRGSEHWSAMTTSGENSWICRSDAEGSSCGCPGDVTPDAAPEEEEEEEETPALIQQTDMVGSEGEVCCLCFDEDGEKTTWDVKAFDDDSSATLQGAGFMDCRHAQDDGTSKCEAHCASLGFQMKGCEKSHGMFMWRGSEHWSAMTTSGENSWICRSDAEGPSCECPGEAPPAATPEEEEEEEEETPALVQQAAASETEVCCVCFEEDGEKTTWDIKTFDDDASSERQGAGFLDCRQDQGDGTSKCSEYCGSLGYEMKGCMKSAGMMEWRENEFWSALTTSGANSWSCRSDAEDISCGCPEDATPA